MCYTEHPLRREQNKLRRMDSEEVKENMIQISKFEAKKHDGEKEEEKSLAIRRFHINYFFSLLMKYYSQW